MPLPRERRRRARVRNRVSRRQALFFPSRTPSTSPCASFGAIYITLFPRENGCARVSRRLASSPRASRATRRGIARGKIRSLERSRPRVRSRVARVALARGVLIPPRVASRDVARGGFTARARVRPRTRARATLETSTRAKSDSRRCRAPFCGDARAGRGARRSRRARNARCAIEARRPRDRARDGERDARARATRFWTRGGRLKRDVECVESSRGARCDGRACGRASARWARV